MSDQMLLAAIIGPMLLVLGLSLLMYTKVWQKISSDFEKDHLAMLPMMVFNLVFGLVVINLYNVWEWSPYVVITIVGWGGFLKAVAYFLLPGSNIKSLIKATNSKGTYQLTGVVIGVLGAWLSYLVYLV